MLSLGKKSRLSEAGTAQFWGFQEHRTNSHGLPWGVMHAAQACHLGALCGVMEDRRGKEPEVVHGPGDVHRSSKRNSFSWNKTKNIVVLSRAENSYSKHHWALNCALKTVVCMFWGEMPFVLHPSNPRHSIIIINKSSPGMRNSSSQRFASQRSKPSNATGTQNQELLQNSCTSTPVCTNSSHILKIWTMSSISVLINTLYLRSTDHIFTLILWLCLGKFFQVMFNQVCQFVHEPRSFQWTFWGPNWEGIFGSSDSSFHLKKSKRAVVNINQRP